MRLTVTGAVTRVWQARRIWFVNCSRPPGVAALAEATLLLGPEGCDVVVDLARYAEFVERTR